MQPTPARSRWLRWLRKWQTPVFGMVLGVLQLLIIWAWLFEHWSSSVWWPWLALSALLDLLLPALAGFLAASQTEDVYSGLGAGCLVGGMSILILAIPAVALSMVAYLAPPRPPCLAPCEAVDPQPDWRFYALAAPILLVLLAGLYTAIWGTVGGWIGGMLGQRHIPRLH